MALISSQQGGFKCLLFVMHVKAHLSLRGEGGLVEDGGAEEEETLGRSRETRGWRKCCSVHGAISAAF